MRFVIVRGATNEVVTIRSYAEVVENGIFVGDTIYGEPGLIIREAEEIPAGVGPSTHCYDGEEFTVNPDYTIPAEVIELAQVKAELEDTRTRLEAAEAEHANLLFELVIREVL